MIMNRIADVFFIIAIILIILCFKTTDFVVVMILIPYIVTDIYSFLGFDFYFISLISFFLFIGAIGKSAQIGLHTWLPDAMEGPTPVSSLLHAATMVTAGVFLIIRCSLIFEYSPFSLFLLLFFGGVTSLFAGIIAIAQYDLKKIIAYSTCSHWVICFFLVAYQIIILHFFIYEIMHFLKRYYF